MDSGSSTTVNGQLRPSHLTHVEPNTTSQSLIETQHTALRLACSGTFVQTRGDLHPIPNQHAYMLRVKIVRAQGGKQPFWTPRATLPGPRPTVASNQTRPREQLPPRRRASTDAALAPAPALPHRTPDPRVSPGARDHTSTLAQTHSRAGPQPADPASPT
ncbi:hypothetical protein OBBRIDRAFT_833362 [Obba rivulosa]|uniref:Uncharacterized protein n=1 Tax=Obba rivulosa TaxID=1052685 RepID=A0A8E2B226_9APHY|nr:hypothetical protein OBBRIDRAFT_833362 [Obba rivulosa]